MYVVQHFPMPTLTAEAEEELAEFAREAIASAGDEGDLDEAAERHSALLGRWYEEHGRWNVQATLAVWWAGNAGDADKWAEFADSFVSKTNQAADQEASMLVRAFLVASSLSRTATNPDMQSYVWLIPLTMLHMASEETAKAFIFLIRYAASFHLAQLLDEEEGIDFDKHIDEVLKASQVV